MTAPSNRRTFLKTVAAAGVAAALPAGRAEKAVTGGFSIKANFYASAAASVMVSGGSITLHGKFPPTVTAAHQLHFGARKRVLLILHATLPADRDAMERRLQILFAADGYESESLHHWEGQDARRRIEEAEAIFVGGGETFLLLRTLLDTQQLAVLRQRILAGTPVHGTSAGANVSGPDIGCTNDFPVVDVPARLALGIFPAIINPHHPRQEEPERPGRALKILTYLRMNPRESVLGLGNGAMARLHEKQVEILQGSAFFYQGTGYRELAPGRVPELTALVNAHA